MPSLWTGSHRSGSLQTGPLQTSPALVRRIDRCYLVAAGTRVQAKRDTYLERARHYRRLLAAMTGRPQPAPAR